MLVIGKISRETIITRKTFLRSVKYPERGGTESSQTSQVDLDAEGFIPCMIQNAERLLQTLVADHRAQYLAAAYSGLARTILLTLGSGQI